MKKRICRTCRKEIPDRPGKHNNLIFSFGGRIRVSGLTTDDAAKWIDQIVTVGGWIRTLRLAEGGDIAFIELNDGSSFKSIQIVVSKDLSNYAEIIKEGIGSCLQVKGLVVKSPGNKQPIELSCKDNNVNSVKIIGTCDQGEYKLVNSKDRMKLEVKLN